MLDGRGQTCMSSECCVAGDWAAKSDVPSPRTDRYPAAEDPNLETPAMVVMRDEPAQGTTGKPSIEGGAKLEGKEAKYVSWCCGPVPAEVVGITSLDEMQAVKYAQWCLYCCCGGFGGSEVSSPFSVSCKCCVCFQDCKNHGQCVDRDGWGSCLHSTCCTSVACQLPPRLGAPALKCCGLECCQGLRFARDRMARQRCSAEPSGGPLHPHDALFDQCVLWYVFCLGCTCKPIDLEQFCLCRTTCCSCHTRGGTMTPSCSEESWSYGWLGCFLALGRLYGQCKVPFHCKDSPIVACCGRNYQTRH